MPQATTITNIEYQKNTEYPRGAITVNATNMINFPGDNEFIVPCLIRFIAEGHEPVEFDHGRHLVSTDLHAVMTEAVEYCREDLEAAEAEKQAEQNPQTETDEPVEVEQNTEEETEETPAN